MRKQVTLFLESDTIEHLDWIVEELTKSKNVRCSCSGAVTWLVNKHRKKVKRKTKAVKSESVAIHI